MNRQPQRQARFGTPALLTVAAAGLLVGCGERAGPLGLEPALGRVLDVPTTDSELARQRLDLDIQAAEMQLATRGSSEHAERVLALRLQRASAFGTYGDDFGRAAELSEAFGGKVAVSGASARHLFPLVLTDPEAPELARAAALIAVGRSEEAEDDLRTLTETFPGARVPRLLLSAALAARGDHVGADAELVEALSRYRGVSPFVVAEIYFRRGVLWAERAGRPDLGERMYRQGLEHLPGHVSMGVHLAELEFERGETEAALARLDRRLAAGTQDPEPWSKRAEWHPDPGQRAEAAVRADAGYRALVAAHPEAFWDHASEFYSGPGDRAETALDFALRNLAARPTDRALLLVLEAADAAGRPDAACRVARTTSTPRTDAPLLETIRNLGCS